jgi:outer membrane murein-binding lipoprotein Lpp
MRALWVFGLAVLLAAGCGDRQKPQTFSTENQELVKGMISALGSKKMDQLDRNKKAAEARVTNGKMGSDEIGAINYAYELAKKGEWDKAKDYMDKCLTSGK